jgi:hypothetical protein
MMKKRGTCLLLKEIGKLDMKKNSRFTARYTIYVAVEETSEDKAHQFPMKLISTMHHAFPGLEVSVVREPDEDI